MYTEIQVRQTPRRVTATITLVVLIDVACDLWFVIFPVLYPIYQVDSIKAGAKRAMDQCSIYGKDKGCKGQLKMQLIFQSGRAQALLRMLGATTISSGRVQGTSTNPIVQLIGY